MSKIEQNGRSSLRRPKLPIKGGSAPEEEEEEEEEGGGGEEEEEEEQQQQQLVQGNFARCQKPAFIR